MGTALAMQHSSTQQSPIQRALHFVLPARLFASMERQSRSWAVRGACGFESTVWDMGGIRWMAAGSKAMWGKCPGCGARHRFDVTRVAEPADRSAPPPSE